MTVPVSSGSKQTTERFYSVKKRMSFFGFDAVLPERRDRPDDLLEDDTFGGRGGAEEEDLAVYTWGEDDYDGLGDQLNEAGDDLNDDTFGAFEDQPKVGRDFDFFGNTAKLDDRQPAPTKASKAAAAPSPSAQGRSFQEASSRPSAEDLWKKQSSLQYTPPVSSPARNSYSPFDQPIPGTSAASQQKRGKTLEDIEAEMLASAARPKPRTMEEIEAEMLMGGGGRPGPSPGFPQHQHQHQQHMQHQSFMHEQQQQQAPMGGHPSPFPPNLAPQGYPQHGPPMGVFPPLPGRQMHQLPPHLQQVQHQTPQQMHQQLQLLQQQAQIPPQQLQQMQQQMLQQRPIEHQQMQQQLPLQQPQQPQQQSQVQQQQQASSFNLAEMFPALPGQTIAANPSTELMGALVGLNAEQQAEVKHELERKIKEQERADEKRMRKARKIASMATYNDIMTRSDKDFITRIQVSQLVTQDPYADDFYAQVYGAIIRSKLGAPNGSSSVIRLSKDGSGVGVGMPGQKGAGRKEGAMHKMALQVKRIVDAAKQRERAPADAHLEGVLGKVTVRTSKTAPRPMLSTQGSNPSSPAVPKLDGKAPHMHATQGEPLTRRQTLIVLEELYSLVLKLEQLRRDSPPFQLIAEQGSDDEKKLAEEWQEDYKKTSAQLWHRLAIDEPVDISDPHPFISLLTPTKGKRLFPRLLRHLSSAQVLTVFTLLLACFSQVDVVRYAPHPVPPHSKDDEAKEKETDLFLGAILPAFLGVLDRCELKIVAGMLGLIVSRCDVPRMSRTRPGIVLFTVLLSRAELLKQGTPEQPADPADLAQWERAFDLLFQRLAPILPTLFPSSTLPPAFGPSLYAQKTPGGVDALDMPVWQMLSSMALHANMQQQQTLVGELREKVLEGVVASKQRWVDEETARRKIANVDLLRLALGLDSGMIAA